MAPHRDRPQVFLCHADANQDTADQLHKELRARRVRTFYPQRDLLPGDQIVHMIEKRLTESDYFLLLWSHACQGQPWVRDQWQARLHEKRGFLFVLRLDNSRVPPLLAARRQFDAFEDWDGAVAALAGCWERDVELGHPVLPVPVPLDHGGGPTVTIYIRNRALDISHVLAVPATATGAQLRAQVRAELALSDEVSDFDGGFGGRLGLRFSYDLLTDEGSIPDYPLDRTGIADGSIIDLKITMRPFTQEGEHTSVVFRRDLDLDLPGMSPATRRSLLRKSFGHLLSKKHR